MPYLVASMAAVVTAIRLILWRTVKHDNLGLRIGNILYDYMLVPVAIVLLFYYNVSSAKALVDADKKQQQQQQSMANRRFSGSGTTQNGRRSSSRDLEAGRGSETENGGSQMDGSRHRIGSGSQHQHVSEGDDSADAPGGLEPGKKKDAAKSYSRNRVIIARLLRVSVVVTAMWIWIVG